MICLLLCLNFHTYKIGIKIPTCWVIKAVNMVIHVKVLRIALVLSKSPVSVLFYIELFYK